MTPSYIKYSVEFINDYTHECSTCRLMVNKIFRLDNYEAVCQQCIVESYWRDDFVYVRTELPKSIYEDFHISEISNPNNPYSALWRPSIAEAKRFTKSKI